MIEYHGWITIQTGAAASNEKLLSTIVEQLNDHIQQLAFPYELSIRYFNDTPYLWVIGDSNHRTSKFDSILKLFELTGRLASGSYGLLYMRDDEDPQGHSNEFQVWRLARGISTSHPDPFLSPIIPTVEGIIEDDQ